MSAICHGPIIVVSPLANFSFVYVIFFITILLTHKFRFKDSTSAVITPVSFDDVLETQSATPPSRDHLICEAAAQALLKFFTCCRPLREARTYRARASFPLP